MAPDARDPIVEGSYYHIIARGNNRQHIFEEAKDFKTYLGLMKKYKDRYPLHIFHYCLMNNHIHLLVQVLQKDLLRRFMQGISQSYSVYFRTKHSYVGHVWQGRYKSLLIENDEYLLECGRYIENNPVRACMTTHPAEWEWSSAGHYLNGKENDLINDNEAYLALANTPKERQGIYREYVTGVRSYEKLVDRSLNVV